MAVMVSSPSTSTAAEGAVSGEEDDRFRVLVAGGGVAAIEAVLALHEFAAEQVAIELLCPTEQFTLRALSVAQPFGGEEPRVLSLVDFCREHGATFRRDALAEVWGQQHRVLSASGIELPYDALLLAMGARQRLVLPGARPFRGTLDADWYADLLRRLEGGSLRRLAFVVPPSIRWSLPLVELALLTAHRQASAEDSETELVFITHERTPLEVFGEKACGHVRALLERGGVEIVAERRAARVDDGRIEYEDGEAMNVDEAVTLPGLRVPDIPGVAQGRDGFIACDPEMRVEGTPGVWVAGDASWFPIKQGGIAAQQAGVAAGWIAAEAGVDVLPEPFRPVLRAALLTGGEPEFLRHEMGQEEDGAATAASPLWWPPMKVAGPRLAPYLGRRWGGGPGDPLVERLEDLEPDDEHDAEEEHRAALELALDFARIDADEGNFDDALRWLDVAERLNVTLPVEYVERRRTWREQLAAHGDELAR